MCIVLCDTDSCSAQRYILNEYTRYRIYSGVLDINSLNYKCICIVTFEALSSENKGKILSRVKFCFYSIHPPTLLSPRKQNAFLCT